MSSWGVKATRTTKGAGAQEKNSPTIGSRPRGSRGRARGRGGKGRGQIRGHKPPTPGGPLPPPPQEFAPEARYGAPGSLGAPALPGAPGGSLGFPTGGAPVFHPADPGSAYGVPGSLGAPVGPSSAYGTPGSLGPPTGSYGVPGSLGRPTGGVPVFHPADPGSVHGARGSVRAPAGPSSAYGTPGSLGPPSGSFRGPPTNGGGPTFHPAAPGGPAYGLPGSLGRPNGPDSRLAAGGPAPGSAYGTPGQLGSPAGGGLGAPVAVTGALGVPQTRSDLSRGSPPSDRRTAEGPPLHTPAVTTTPASPQYDEFVSTADAKSGSTSDHPSATSLSPKGLERFEMQKAIAFEDLLKQHGLERFTEKFREEELDEESLLMLTDADLKDMGIATGPRKKILRILHQMKANNAAGSARYTVFCTTETAGTPPSTALMRKSMPDLSATVPPAFEGRRNTLTSAGISDSGGGGTLGNLVADRWKINYFKLDIDVKDKIGEGNFGTVWKGNWRKAPCVIKKLKNLEGDEALLDWEKEVNVLMNLRPHPNLITFLGVCMKPPNLALVTEFCPLGDLAHVLKKVKLPLVTKAKVAVGAAAGMVHLHAEGLLHNDFAARNLLVVATESGLDVKITDFGMSKKGTEYEAVNQVMAIKWMSPEGLTGKFSQASDCWSYGMMCYELLTDGLEPYNGMDNVGAFVLIREGTCPELPAETPADFRQVVEATWKFDASERPSFSWINDQLDDIYERLRETGEREAMVADILGTGSSAAAAAEMEALEKERARLAAEREEEHRQLEATKLQMEQDLAWLRHEKERIRVEEQRRTLEHQAAMRLTTHQHESSPVLAVPATAERKTRTMPHAAHKKGESTPNLLKTTSASARSGRSKSPRRSSKSGSKSKSSRVSGLEETGSKPEIAKLVRPSKSDVKEFGKRCVGTDINPKDFLFGAKCQTVREETGKYVEGKLFAARTTLLYCFKEKSKEFKMVIPFKRIKSVWYASQEMEKKGRSKRTKLVPKKGMDSNTVGLLLFIKSSKGGVIPRAFVHFGAIGDLVNLYSIVWYQQPILQQKKV